MASKKLVAELASRNGGIVLDCREKDGTVWTILLTRHDTDTSWELRSNGFRRYPGFELADAEHPAECVGVTMWGALDRLESYYHYNSMKVIV